MDDNTTLSDLLSLNLHNFEDDVRGIVDKAVKEMSMEKVLKELDATWTTMEFEHEPHPRTKITMLKTSEELIETLEDNQVCKLIEFLCQVKRSLVIHNGGKCVIVINILVFHCLISLYRSNCKTCCLPNTLPTSCKRFPNGRRSCPQLTR